MEKEPLVSVIMANYNHSDFIAESIESVLNQTYKNIQLIIVDDGSDDDSVDIIKSFHDERMEVYPCKINKHVSAATNYALQYVKGEYVAIADSDDVWQADKLRKQITYLQEHPKYEACFTWVTVINENGEDVSEEQKDIIDIFNASTDTREEWLRFFFFIGNRLANSTSVVTAKALEDIGEHNIAFVQGHDFDWWIRFTKKYSFAIIEEPLLKYRRYISSNSSNTSAKTDINDIRFYNEYMVIRMHFFDDMDKDTFISVFSSQFRNKQSVTEIELECEKAFLMCTEFNAGCDVSACGLLYLERLLQNAEARKILKEKFDFDQKSFYELNSNSAYVDNVVKRKLKYVEEVKNLRKLAADLNGLLEEKRIEVKKLTEMTDALKLKKADVEEQLQLEIRENIKLNNAIESIQNSTSWKITRPLRGVKNLINSGEK